MKNLFCIHFIALFLLTCFCQSGMLSAARADVCSNKPGIESEEDTAFASRFSTGSPTPSPTPVPGTSTPTPFAQLELFLMDNDYDSGYTDFAVMCDPEDIEIELGYFCPTDCVPSDDTTVGWAFGGVDIGMHWQYYVTEPITLQCTRDIHFDLCYGYDGWSTHMVADFYVYWRCADNHYTVGCDSMTEFGPTGYWTPAWSDVGVDWPLECTSRSVSGWKIMLPCGCDTIELMIAVHFDGFGDYYGIRHFRVYHNLMEMQCGPGFRNCGTPATATPDPTPTVTPQPIPATDARGLLPLLLLSGILLWVWTKKRNPC